MAIPSVSLTLSDRLNLHYTEYGEKRLNSQAWKRQPLMNWLMSKAKPYQGGTYISETIEENYTPLGGSITEGSTLTLQGSNLTTAAQYRMKYLWEPVYLDEIKRREIDTPGNMGPILKWGEESLQAAVRKIKDNAATMVAASTTSGNDITSIFDIVKASGSLGGIDPSSYPWWVSQLHTSGTTWSSTGVTRLRTLLRQSRKYAGWNGPDAFFASATTIDAMKAGGYTKTTFFRDPATAKGYDIGDGPKFTPDTPDTDFDGIPVWYDPYLDALEAAGPASVGAGGVLLGVNSEAVYLRQGPSPFGAEGWRQSDERWATFNRCFYGGNLVCRNRWSNILMAAIS